MPSVNHQKKEKMFLRAISQIITEEINNANVYYPTVTDVKLSTDGLHLNVYLTFENNKTRSMEAIQASRGFVRSSLAKRVKLRKVPEIHFKNDESSVTGNRINEILNQIKGDK